MPQYRFICSRGHETEKYLPLSKFKKYIKCKHDVREGTDSTTWEPATFFPCGLRATLGIPKVLSMRSFKPYVEEHMTGKPIEITSSKQRDQLCKQHGVTYDKAKYFTKPKRAAAVDCMTDDEIHSAIEKSRIPDDVYKRKLPPVVAKDSFD